MTIKKKILLFISIPTALLLVRLLTIPSCITTEWALSGLDNRYHVVDYGDFLDTSKVQKTIIYSGFFSFDKTLDATESKELLKIMLDSNSYDRGEWGTPEYTKSFYYVASDGNAIGKTVFDNIGQTRTWPSTKEQTKWGALSQQGLKKVFRLTQ